MKCETRNASRGITVTESSQSTGQLGDLFFFFIHLARSNPTEIRSTNGDIGPLQPALILSLLRLASPRLTTPSSFLSSSFFLSLIIKISMSNPSPRGCQLANNYHTNKFEHKKKKPQRIVKKRYKVQISFNFKFLAKI